MSYGFGYMNNFARRAYMNAVNHGFWVHYNPKTVDTALVKLALIVSEVGEAVEAVRKGDDDNLAEELADIIIRVFDLAEARGLNIEQAVVNKMGYNETRSHMHGKLA